MWVQLSVKLYSTDFKKHLERVQLLSGKAVKSSDHFIVCANAKSLCSTLETSIILYLKYISMKEKKSSGENMGWETGMNSDPNILLISLFLLCRWVSSSSKFLKNKTHLTSNLMLEWLMVYGNEQSRGVRVVGVRRISENLNLGLL